MFHHLHLRQLARQEYAQARGTAHKQLLSQARDHIQSLYRKNLNKGREAETKIKALHARREQELERVLVRHLVENRLQEIHGIGPQRKAAILQQVFRGKLNDLQHASKTVPGITPKIQSEINRWVTQNQKALPDLINQDFPGKASVDARYCPEIESLERLVRTLESENHPLQEKLKRINEELVWLNQITPGTFVKSLRKPEQVNPELDRYLCGVFAEWETVPEWFREIVSFSGKLPENLLTARATSTKARPVKEVISRLNADTQPSPPRSTLRKAVELAIIIGAIAGMFFFCFLLILSTDVTKTTVSPEIPTIVATNTRRPSATPGVTATPRILATAQPDPTATYSPSATQTNTPTFTPTETATVTAVPLPQVRVIISAANLRAGPDANQPVVGIARAGDLLVVIEAEGNGAWLLVQTGDGLEAWIGSTVVEPVNEETN